VQTATPAVPAGQAESRASAPRAFQIGKACVGWGAKGRASRSRRPLINGRRARIGYAVITSVILEYDVAASRRPDCKRPDTMRVPLHAQDVERSGFVTQHHGIVTAVGTCCPLRNDRRHRPMGRATIKSLHDRTRCGHNYPSARVACVRRESGGRSLGPPLERGRIAFDDDIEEG
jgi:hypothetical protein